MRPCTRPPTSTLTGTPFISYWLNFQPGVLSVLASTCTRTPAPRSAASSRCTAAITASPSTSFFRIGTMTTCREAGSSR